MLLGLMCSSSFKYLFLSFGSGCCPCGFIRSKAQFPNCQLLFIPQSLFLWCVCLNIRFSISPVYFFLHLYWDQFYLLCLGESGVFLFFSNRIFSPGLASSNRQRRETLQSFQRYRAHSSSSDTTRPVAMELWVCRLILHFGAGVKHVYRTGSADEEREQKTSRSLNIWLHQKQQRKTMLT